MEINFNPGTDELVLRYDTDARDLLRGIAEPVHAFLKGNIVATQCEPVQRDELEQGWRVLEKLTADVTAHTTALGANLALELVAFSSQFVARDSSWAELFSRALLFLAAVGPAPLLPLPLPPADEVFKARGGATGNLADLRKSPARERPVSASSHDLGDVQFVATARVASASL